jgi:hypothetical protein
MRSSSSTNLGLSKLALTNPGSGVNFLSGSKVGSSSGYICVAGQILSIPHRSKSASSLGSTATAKHNLTEMSESRSSFREAPYCYASMQRKPLTPYHPNAHRSRLAQPDAPVPCKNSSSIDFNSGLHICHKRRFMTQHRVNHVGSMPDPRTNQGIIAEATKFRRSQDNL